jgi:opacity protein-like surface antigen
MAAHAQLSIIPKAGVNFSTISNHNFFTNRSSLTGFTAGVGLNYSLSGDNFLSVQPELLYSQKGFSAEGNIVNVINFEGDYRLNYLELPLLVKVGFGSDALTAYLNAGPSVSYLLGGRINGRGNILGIGLLGTNYNEKIRFTENPSLTNLNDLDANRIDFGLSFGGGIGYNIAANSSIFVDVRYNLGLSEFDRNQDAKNRVIALTAGVKLPL